MKKILFIISLAFFFSAPFLSAENSLAPIHLSFSEALRIAEEKSPTMIMADERVKQALERLNQARAVFFPQVSGNLSEKRQTMNLETVGLKPAGGGSPVVGPFNAFDARVKLSQTLFDWALVKRLESVGATRDLSKAEQMKAKEDVLALVGTLYIEAKRAEDALWFSKAVLRLSQEKYRLANTHNKWGTGSDIEVKQAKADLSESRFEWRLANQKAVDRRLDLKVALGFSESQAIELESKDFFFNIGLPKSKEIMNAASKHPEVITAESKLRELAAQNAAEKAGFLPKISGTVDYGASAEQPSDSKETYAYGLQLSWPLFEGGQRNARVAESDSASREAKTNFNDVKNQKEAKAFQAKGALKNAKTLILAKRDSFEYYHAQMELARHRYANGTASELELIHSAAEEAQAKDQKDESVAVYRLAEINLAHALGQMDRFLENMRKK